MEEKDNTQQAAVGIRRKGEGSTWIQTKADGETGRDFLGRGEEENERE